MRLCLVAHCLVVLCLLSARIAAAQSISIEGTVVDERTSEAVAGARVALKPSKLGAISDSAGHFIVANVPPGRYQIVVTRLGYQTQPIAVEALQKNIVLSIILLPEEEERDEVVVTGTRTVRSISDVPVRVEVVPQEEVDEKTMMRPASVAMLLNESAGIRVQNTSATSNTANIRIQGLDGRYTQLLIDGIPSFSGMAAGFGITQLIPLNLQQVEFVKGASSGLYGPDAIAGVINFITKEPHPDPEVSALVNVTSQKGFDLSGYYGQQFDSIGVTMLASYNRQSRFDVNGDNFSDLAEYSRLTLTPKLEYSMEDAKLTATMSYFHEERLGGVMTATSADIGSANTYLESNKTDRLNVASSFDWSITDKSSIVIRAAGMSLVRDSYYGATPFDGTQKFLFSDALYTANIGEHTLLLSSAFTSEGFDDRTPGISASRTYSYQDLGVWVQDELRLTEQWKFLWSGRYDHHIPFGDFITPRASVLFKPLPALTFRLGGGTGFKAPTIFLEEAELRGFRNTYPITNLKIEEAKSVSFDMNYRTIIFGGLAATFNLALYRTELERALLLSRDSLLHDAIYFQNATGATVAQGAEVNMQVSYEQFKLNVMYAYLHAQQTNEDKMYELELNPRHWLGLVLMYEDSDLGLKAGVESYFISSQFVEDDPFRTKTEPYWLNGFMVEKAFGNFRLFLNAEDIFDVRQTRYEQTFLGDPSRGDYRPLRVWAPLEGRSFNGGVRYVL